MKLMLLGFAVGSLAVLTSQPAAAQIRHDDGIRTVTTGPVTLSYRIVGPAKGRPLLLIAGTGMQLIEWPPELVDGLAKQGFRVIAFDHRDAGGSTHFTHVGPPDWPAIMTALGTGKTPPLPYTADDMARDALRLLDALRIKHADLLGISGGATIAELVAIVRPDRVRSLNLIAANSGNPAIPVPADSARLMSVPQPASGDDAASRVAKRLAMHRALAARGSTFDEGKVRPTIEQAIARDPDAFGYARQGAAMVALGDLRARLAAIRAPTLVVHGADDPLISPQSGREVAGAIPSATYLLIAGMGHDLNAEHVPALLDAVRTNATRAR